VDAFIVALALGMLPAAGYVPGGLIAETVAISEKTLSFELHVAAGAMLTVVSVHLMPQVRQHKCRP
jgi:ZIP family zinc transporter